MIKFYYSGAPNPMKVALMLEETGLPYEPIPVDTRKGEQHTPEFLAINPNGKVPAIVDGDATVFDSNAILLYLAEKTGKFLPANTPKARGELLSWLMFVASGVGPFSGQSVHFRHYAPEKIHYAVNRYMYEAQRHYAVVNERLGKHKFMVADSVAAGRRDFGKARGQGRPRGQGQTPARVQGRVRRGSAQGHVQAPGCEGRLSVCARCCAIGARLPRRVLAFLAAVPAGITRS